ncbi:MAG: hypothetical protein HY749_07920 [Gammaproteobacteria bacterium]|nr:hypothetical protein [Gammaproteobacteria bacterium]
MITAKDADFHTPANADFRWCETRPFMFNVPEANISGTCYTVTRPVLGVCMSDVTIFDRISQVWEHQLYVDNQQHLPCPKSLLDYALPNGLSVRASKPTAHYAIRYEGIDDTLLDFEFEAIMAPYDMNDPDTNPLARARHDSGWNDAFGGHYEQAGRVRGTASIRGREYRLDTIEVIDRSWGPRAERDNGAAVWLHANFGEGLVMHALFSFDPAHTREFGALITGFVLEDGKVYGAVSIAGRGERAGLLPMGTELLITDVRGKSFLLTGSAVNSGPWAPYPSLVYATSMMRWNCDGRVGHGIHQNVVSRAYMTRHREKMQAG